MAELAYTLDVTEDDRLDQAEALVRSYCGWHIAPSRTETVTVYPTPDGRLLLPSMYVTAITSITEQGGTALAAEDFRFFPHGEVQRLDLGWSWSPSPGGVNVVFTHGYDLPPADVTAIVQALATRAIGNTAGLKSKGVGPFTETYSTELLPLERGTLAQYRIPARF